MAERWVGIVVAGEKVTLADAEVPATGPMTLQFDHTWKLQAGSRPAAYCVMHQQVFDYLAENKIIRVIIKASALSTGATKMSHLEAAELRGVVFAAAAAVTSVTALSKAHISRTFGGRKVDEYIADNSFWSANVAGANLRAGSREAALMILAARV